MNRKLQTSKKDRPKLQRGRYVWLACEVRPGPFSNERRVKVRSGVGDEWVGFVPTTELKDPVTSGHTYIRGLVVRVEGDQFYARLPGEPIMPAQFTDEISRAELIA